MNLLSISRTTLPFDLIPGVRGTYPLPRFRRFKTALAIFSGMYLLVILLAWLLPRRYEASMQFLVSNDRVNAPIGQNSNTQAIVYLDDVSEARINTEVALLLSNELLEQVVRECQLAYFVPGDNLSPERREDIALRQLRDHLSVSPLRRSAVIQVRYESPSRERSIAVLRSLSRLYLDSHLRLRGTPESYEFYRSIWAQTSAERVIAETTLRHFKLHHNIVSLPEEKNISLQHQAELETQYADAAAAAQRTHSQDQRLTSLLSSTPATIVGERKTVSNQYEIQQLSTTLLGLQNKRVEAASRYLPTDRFVRDLDEQIAQTKAALSAANLRKTEETTVLRNPVATGAQAQSLQVQSESAGYLAQASELGRRLAANRRHLLDLDAQTSIYNQLSENVGRLKDLEKDYRQKADAARVSQMLDQKHISDLAVSDAPFATTEASSPKVGAILSVGFLWSLFTSFGTVLLLNRRRAVVQSPLQVEAALGAPVLAFVCTDPGISAHRRTDSPVYLSTPAVHDRQNGVSLESLVAR